MDVVVVVMAVATGRRMVSGGDAGVAEAGGKVCARGGASKHVRATRRHARYRGPDSPLDPSCIHYFLVDVDDDEDDNYDDDDGGDCARTLQREPPLTRTRFSLSIRSTSPCCASKLF